MIRIERGTINAMASRELVQPFGPSAFMQEGASFAGYASIIDDLWRQCGGAASFGVTLSHEFAVLRKIPSALGLSQDQLDKHLKWEAEQGLISSLQNYFIDYQRLPVSSHLGHPLYLLVLLRKIIIEQLKVLSHGLRARLVDIDIDVFAYIRTLLKMADVNNDDLIAIVSMVNAKISVVLIQQCDYILMNHITVNEAGRTNKSSMYTDVALALIKELKRIIFGHRLGSGLEALNSIYFIGEEVSGDLISAVSAQIKIPVKRLEILSRVKLSSEAARQNSSEAMSLQYTAAIGMALKQNAITIP